MKFNWRSAIVIPFVFLRPPPTLGYGGFWFTALPLYSFHHYLARRGHLHRLKASRSTWPQFEILYELLAVRKGTAYSLRLDLNEGPSLVHRSRERAIHGTARVRRERPYGRLSLLAWALISAVVHARQNCSLGMGFFKANKQSTVEAGGLIGICMLLGLVWHFDSGARSCISVDSYALLSVASLYTLLGRSGLFEFFLWWRVRLGCWRACVTQLVAFAAA